MSLLHPTLRHRQKSRPSAVPTRFYDTTRLPRDNDPGEVEYGHFVLDDGAVQLTDADGKPIQGYRHELQPQEGAWAVARTLLRQHLDRRYANNPFGRPLKLPPLSIA